MTLTWVNTGAASYSVRLSQDLSDWSEILAAGISEDEDESPEDADYITVTFTPEPEQQNLDHLFFRIQEE